jgi:aminopeptidase-like protein
VRTTLARIAEEIPLEVPEVPTGTPVFDWTVPKEWNLERAWIRGPGGETVVDTGNSHLHVVGYSVPVRRTMTLEELRPHLHTLPEHPDRIPYRTSYYRETWGFCLRHRTLEALEEGEYEVGVDATLEGGHMTWGECFLPGATEDEVLVSTHICHPTLCNDNLSGLTVATELARALAEDEGRHYGYRFLFIPGTIGSITWLALNEARTDRIAHGLVLTGVGDRGAVTWKRTRAGDAEIDRAVEHVLRTSGRAHQVRDFSPYGYDERQYGSPGFRLPVGCLMRTPHGEYDEYHTSADDLDFVAPEALADSYRVCRQAFRVLEENRTYRNLNPKCEPQLGRRGVYRMTGGSSLPGLENAMLWVLSFSDGSMSLLDIAERAGLPFRVVAEAARTLESVGLLEVAS